MNQDLTGHVQAERIEKFSNADLLCAHMLSNASSEFLSKLQQETLDFFNLSISNGKMANNDEVTSVDGKMEQNEAIKAFTKMAKMANNYDVVSDDGKMDQNEFIKAFKKLSTKDTIVSDGNDSETSSFSVTNSDNKVKNNNF